MQESRKPSECLSSFPEQTKLSLSQTAAVTCGGGPVLVLAGPGSGKTTVITHRLRFLIDHDQAAPEKILVITFSRAAAAEMKERFEQMYRRERKHVVFGTFHAVFFRILQLETGIGPGSVLSGTERLEMIGRIVKEMSPERENDDQTAAAAAREISLVKNERIPIEYYYSTSCPEEMFRTLFRSYEKMLSGGGRIDFDDMALRLEKLFKERPDILERWQKRFSHILIDEFQDIDALQYDIVRMLGAPENNLFVVGDDDQSIYRFRGAKPEIMLGFERDHPGARRIQLEENYRSGKGILDAAGAVIRENKNRFPKTIRCASPEAGNEKPQILVFNDPGEESLYLTGYLRKNMNTGRDPGQTALLVRTNLQASYYAQRLMEMQIPFSLRDTPLCLYDHWICRDLCAYLHLAGQDPVRKDMLQVMNRPNRYLSRDCLETETVSFARLEQIFRDRPWMWRRIRKMREDLALIGSMPVFAAVNYIRKGMGYDAFLEEYAAKRRIRTEDLLLTADELQESTAGLKDLHSWELKMDRWRERIRAGGQPGRSPEPEKSGIVISTLHAAKGLEFDEVVIADINEDIIPYRKARLEADIEEERRLLYVGMTRAKRRLHLWYVKKRYGKDQMPSRFLAPLLGP